MGVDLSTPILTKRGLLLYNEVTTDDETLARLPDASLVWTPITGISVVENQMFINVVAPRSTFRCSYEQRVWLSRRTQSGYNSREVIDTIDQALSLDAVIFSGVYLGGHVGRQSHMSVPEARLLALLVAGHGEFVENDGKTHLRFRRSNSLPKWFMRFALEGIEYSEYSDQMIVSPEKSRRMKRLMRNPLNEILWTMTLERREEFLSVFFGRPVPRDVPDMVHLTCFLCFQMTEHVNGSAIAAAGVVPLVEAKFSETVDTAWSVTTEASGWTVRQDGHYMALPS